MLLIVGLGNPGKKYEKTRHNVGFMVLDRLSEDFAPNKKLDADTAELSIQDTKVLLAKPNTYMNNSGQALAKISNFYKINTLNILVVQDEVDLRFGDLKLTTNSGSAGHRGIESIMQASGKEITRLRIGIEARENRDLIPTDDYVLQNFTPVEQKQLVDEIIPEAVEKVRKWVTENSKLQAPNQK